MTSYEQRTSVLLDNVYSLIDSKVEDTQKNLVKQFAHQLFDRIANEDLAHRNVSDLYGATLSLWHAFNAYDNKGPTINVYNPVIERHGWNSSHTIVEAIVDDMPFLVDSVRIALNRLGITAHLLLHSPTTLTRDANTNKVTAFIDNGEDATSACKETILFIEIDRQTTEQELAAIETELKSTLDEVSLVVQDWQPMSTKLAEIEQHINKLNWPCSDYEKRKHQDLITWLSDQNFTLMGYRFYQVKAIEGDHRWIPDNESSLGLMKNSISDRQRVLANVASSARTEALSKSPMMLTKTSTKSRVHRPAYMDYVGIKAFDKKGNVIGEHRFVGLYSAAFYNASAEQLPLLKDKVNEICDFYQFQPQTHAHKAFVNILETYPRDELLQTPVADLAPIVMGIYQMQERGITRLFIRKDVFGRFFSCIVYVPRERYNTQLRIDTQALLAKALKANGEVEFTTFFSESVYARTHYIARIDNRQHTEYDVKQIEENVIELTKTWSDRLASAITSGHGEASGKALERKYSNAFSRSYMESNLPSAALVDIEKLEMLSDDNTLDMLFYRPQEVDTNSDIVRLKLFHRERPIHLSDVLPTLENFGLRVVDESPFKITYPNGSTNWVMDFNMLHKCGPKFDMTTAQTLFQDGFARVWYGELEDDAFNRLILGAELTGRKVTILRAYAKYMRQTGSSFSRDYIAETLATYPHIAGLLVDFFDQRFNPSIKFSQKKQDKLREQIESELDTVSNLDDDRIIRRYLDMMDATLRTNFYQPDEHGNDKSYVSFKLSPENIPDMPLPVPKFEIFVYSPRVEGVHLRGGKVARGGLRWSDRQEDFRTEVLGLVKAQQVKNTVIVPVGAKGGFVCKQLPTEGGREAFLAEGQECYRIFIRSLLDITDNIVDGKVVHPENVVIMDEEDPYLVVAADKGTATFSDIANGIAEQYGFWLGDAFASGGSVGYDHKKMGITARGAWESVKRHFREIGIDCQTTDFTCAGVGDMGGDVFGNGMLLSEHTRLIAAFNHLHIFFDPSPDAKTSYQERKRLFENPRLGWDDYDKSLISKGGGVFSRAAKSITLTPEMKKWLDTRKTSLTPNELIKAILQMPVDLLWNGGIGTYVKSKQESHTEVGDRANDSVRINGQDLRAKIVGEGGNLGFTQLGRIEFAMQGGRVNTDFIDNVGGVDCSDNEVNIKILLNGLVQQGDLTVKQRNELLYEMTDDVAEIVLDDCYLQTLSISVSEQAGVGMLKEQIRFIHGLEKQGALNRELEFLPNDDMLADRTANGVGLTRPELGVLIAYGKMVQKEVLNIPEITDNPYHNKLLLTAFPPVLRERFADSMQQHPLRSEIIATKLTNHIINDMGMNFMYRMQEETGADVANITTAYSVIKAIFNVENIWEQLTELDNAIDSKLQLSMFSAVRRTMRRGIRWYLRHGDFSQPIDTMIDAYRGTYDHLLSRLDEYLVDDERKELVKTIDKYKEQGVPESLARSMAQLSTLFSSLDIAQVDQADDKHDTHAVAMLYFTLGAKLELHWFLEQINNQAVTNHWQALARASFREELDWQQRSLTQNLLAANPDIQLADQIIDTWIQNNEGAINRWYQLMTEFKTSNSHDFAKFSVALRELMLLSLKSSQ